MTAGGMAQANQLPAPAATGAIQKAPGWDRVLGEGIDKPGSLAEKAEAAFNDAKKTGLIVKTTNQLQPVDEKGEVKDLKDSAYLNSPVAAQNTAAPKKPVAAPVEEFEVTDILDFEQPGFDKESFRPVQPIRMQGPPRDEAPSGNMNAGWNMQTEDTMPVQSAAPGQEPAGGGGRRWYKPSTWNKPSKPAAANNMAKGADSQPTPISSFNTDVQRIGVVTPDDNEQPTFSNSPGRRRPRREQPGFSPAPQNAPAVDMDFGFMACPGAIDDAPLPAPTVPVAKAQSNSKHHSSCVERAAFPQEERAAQRAKEAEEKASVAQGKLAQLERQKKDAIAREDFLEANRIKAEIEAFQAQERSGAAAAPAPAPRAAAAPSNAVQPFTRGQPSPEPIVNEYASEVSNQSGQNSRARPRPAAQDNWNAQVEEPVGRSSPTEEQPVRKRFWKPWQGGGAKAAPAPAAPAQEETMVSAFDMGS